MNIKKINKLSVFIIAMLYTSIASSNLIDKLQLTDVDVLPSPIPGFNAVLSNQGLFYISKDEQYLITGELFKVSHQNITSINEEFAKKRLEKKLPQIKQNLAELQSSAITFPAKDEKYAVTVFIDYSCHYCKLLLEQVKEYNDLGITLHLLAFPRAGLDSDVARYMETIYTDKNPMLALINAEKGTLPAKQTAPDVVKKHYELGLELNLQGTPAIIKSNGELIKGYLEPKQLLKELQQ